MDLRDYPRPKNDTGIGIHWNAGFPAAVGLGQIRDFWLPELIAMGVKWVKITRHDGGMDFVELLLKNDIMPIMRLYRPQPNPGVLDEATLKMVSDFVAAGVRYFEFNNEPDLGGEWRDSYIPPDAPTIVARNAIVDMEAILQRGGYPGIPALLPGSKWDLVGEICRLGRRDLFAEPVWQAIHNYSLNHPLDYPYDAGNQQGAPYTAEFYNQLASEQWSGSAWRDYSLERVNEERARNKNPGATAFDDPSCWRAYERYDKLIRDQIGRSLPILATENGYIVDERQDPRYPATTPNLHAAQTLEACRIMMGTSTRFDHAPDYYFCTAFWLLANYNLGHWAPEWESQAWYSGRWPNGRLPVVDVLKAEPKQARQWRGEAGIAGRVTGSVRGGAGLTVQLAPAEGPLPLGWPRTARVDASGHYEFGDVPLGRYRITVVEAEKSQEVTLVRERPAATASFDLGGAVEVTASVVRGVVRGGAGMKVRLMRPADGWSQEQSVAQDGRYRFTGLAAGAYAIMLVDSGVGQGDLLLDGRNEVVVDLAAPGWGWEVTDGGPGPGFGVVRCRVKGRLNHPVALWTGGWAGMVQRTGSKLEYGADACEFAPLGAGRYNVQPEGIDAVAEVTVDGRRVLWVTFTEHTVAPACASVIHGVVTNGGGRTVRLLQPPAPAPVGHVQAAADGSYRFEKLVAGNYAVQVLRGGHDTEVLAEQANIVLDGLTAVQVNLALSSQQAAGLQATVEDGGPGPGFSLVRCQVVDRPGRAVSLWTDGWGGITQLTGSKLEYGPDVCEFAPLGPGKYYIELEEARGPDGAPQIVREQITLPANRVIWVRFRSVAPVTPAEPVTPVEPAEPAQPVEPAQPTSNSVVAGVVANGDGLLVVLSGPGGDRDATVVDGRYRFTGLPAGVYRLAVLAAEPALGELAVREGVSLDGASQVTIDFELPAPAVAESQVVGRVRGGAGRTVVLEGPLADEGPVETRTTTVTAEESYAFTGLPAGAYRVIVRDTDPPTGITQVQAGILLDGANTAHVDLDLDALGPVKTLEHYLFVGVVARSREDFLTILRYVARFGPVVGSDEAEARRARHVTILGGLSAVSAMIEQGMRLAGCQVQRIEADFATHLGKLLDENRPYAS